MPPEKPEQHDAEYYERLAQMTAAADAEAGMQAEHLHITPAISAVEKADRTAPKTE